MSDSVPKEWAFDNSEDEEEEIEVDDFEEEEEEEDDFEEEEEEEETKKQDSSNTIPSETKVSTSSPDKSNEVESKEETSSSKVNKEKEDVSSQKDDTTETKSRDIERTITMYTEDEFEDDEEEQIDTKDEESLVVEKHLSNQEIQEPQKEEEEEEETQVSNQDTEEPHKEEVQTSNQEDIEEEDEEEVIPIKVRERDDVEEEEVQRDPIQARIQHDDELCMDLQDEGNYMEAMETMERSLVFRRNYFGPDSDEVEDACRVLSEMCNLLAMTYLQNDDFATSHKLLQKAELFARNNLPRKAVTLNNFACMYRRRGDLRKALQSLRRAVRIETKLQTMGRVVDKAADTHLNLCAVLSQLSEHTEALGHAQQALILMQEELYPLPNLDNLSPEESEDLPLDRISVLCIAYVCRQYNEQ